MASIRLPDNSFVGPAVCPKCKTNSYTKLFNQEIHRYREMSTLKDWRLFWRCGNCANEFVSFTGDNQMYIIIRDPAEKNNKYPFFQTERKVYESLEQAITVAKKLAVEHPALKFYIAKLIKSAITEPSVSIEDC